MDTKHGNKLINRNQYKEWVYDSTDPYVLPNEGAEGYVEHPNGTVLGILSSHNNIMLNDTLNMVVLEEKSSAITDDQKWLRGTSDNNDWFTLTNPKSGKVLTATSSSALSIEGKSLILIKNFSKFHVSLYFPMFSCFVT